MLKAAIFDMDGLLVDTERYWQQIEREIFARFNIHITPELQKETFGLQTSEVIQHWYHAKPWPWPAFDLLEAEFYEKVEKHIREGEVLMDGAMDILDFFQKKSFRIGVASSSPLRLIEAFLERYQLEEIFDVYHTSVKEEFGKPHPAVYIATAKKLGVKPHECVAFEDSLNGLISAKSAKMKAVAVPEASVFQDPGFGIADLKLATLKDFNTDHLMRLENNHHEN